MRTSQPLLARYEIAVGQRLIQGAPDIFLGRGTQDGFHFYVRQLRDMKGGADYSSGAMPVEYLIERCRLCGWALALAHANPAIPP